MEVWMFKTEWLPHDGEPETETLPCASREIAKSYMDFKSEEIKQRDEFDSGEVISSGMFSTSIRTELGRYCLSIYPEMVLDKPIW